MFSRWPIHVLLTGTVLFGVGIGLLMAAIPNQGRTQFFGSSGGNVNDISKPFCCSGTLGSLVKDSSGVQYILSNNHVLADTDQAAPGQNISQPGLVDNNCRPATTVAHFTVAPHLGTNVDAALAKLVAGTMNSGGSILGIGAPNSTPVSAKINMGVAKSGRTTGLTCGAVQSVNTSVKVQYQKGCNQGSKFTISYTNQVVVASSTFSAGGDSGSLIVSKSAAHPTALLFAGSSTTTVGNPIGQVLSHVSSSLGKQVSFVGSSTRTTSVSCPVAAAVTYNQKAFCKICCKMGWKVFVDVAFFGLPENEIKWRRTTDTPTSLSLRSIEGHPANPPQLETIPSNISEPWVEVTILTPNPRRNFIVPSQSLEHLDDPPGHPL
jgi:hypothetical protein